MILADLMIQKNTYLVSLVPLLVPLYATVISSIDIFRMAMASEKHWVKWAAYTGCVVFSVMLLMFPRALFRPLI